MGRVKSCLMDRLERDADFRFALEREEDARSEPVFDEETCVPLAVAQPPEALSLPPF